MRNAIFLLHTEGIELCYADASDPLIKRRDLKGAFLPERSLGIDITHRFPGERMCALPGPRALSVTLAEIPWSFHAVIDSEITLKLRSPDYTASVPETSR